MNISSCAQLEELLYFSEIAGSKNALLNFTKNGCCDSTLPSDISRVSVSQILFLP